jgi:hypothetical protein
MSSRPRSVARWGVEHTQLTDAPRRLAFFSIVVAASPHFN